MLRYSLPTLFFICCHELDCSSAWYRQQKCDTFIGHPNGYKLQTASIKRNPAFLNDSTEGMPIPGFVE